MSEDKAKGGGDPFDVTLPLPAGLGTTPQPAATVSGGWKAPTVARMQQMLPQYRFIEMLGAGGMGAVYKAMQVSLDRPVAIKILPPDLDDGSGANFTERFKQEARTMARMNHACIVNVYDFGQTADGQFYFVMEFVDGTDVQKLIRANKQLRPEDALAITSHVCDALEYAHARGVIHRDIKPANVLISAEGAVKIADFGLAKAVDHKSHELTRSNIAMGTPHFMAPETMFANVKVDARADLYAVGVMLHNMLTGEIPTGRFELPSKRTGCDRRFDAIVDKAMRADRDERYQHASEIRHDLDTILTTPVADVNNAASFAMSQKVSARDISAAIKRLDDEAQQPSKKEAAQPAKAASAKLPPTRVIAPEETPAPPPPKRSPTPDTTPGLGKIMAMVGAAAVVLICLFAWSPWSKKRDTGTLPVKSGAPSGVVARVAPAVPQPVAVPAPPAPVATGAIKLWSTKESVRENEHVTWVEAEKAVKLSGALRLAADVPPARDGVLRASVKVVEGSYGVFHLRLRSDGGPDKGFCALVLNTGAKKFDLAAREVGTVTKDEFKRIPLPAGLDPMTWNHYEFRIVGDEWTVLVNGQKVDSTRNATRTAPGVPMIVGIGETLFRDVVFTPLDGSAPIPKATFDLLSLTDPVRDRGASASPGLIGANTWEKSGSVLSYKTDGRAGKIAAPVSLNARDYEIEVAFRRTTVEDRFHLDIPLSSTRVIPVIFGSGRTNIIVPGDLVIGGSPAFATALTGRVALRVRPAGADTSSITITLDGAPAGAWTGKLDAIGWKVSKAIAGFPDEPVTSLYCAGTDYTFTSWKLRIFEGEAKVLSR